MLGAKPLCQTQPYERRSTIISTNLVFSEWDQFFKNPMTTVAAVDRVIHHSVIIDLAGVESYRVREAAKKQKHREFNPARLRYPSK